MSGHPPPAAAVCGAGAGAPFFFAAGAAFCSDFCSDFTSDFGAAAFVAFGFACFDGVSVAAGCVACCADAAVSRPTAAASASASASGRPRYPPITTIGPPASSGTNAPEVIEITGEIGNVKAAGECLPALNTAICPQVTALRPDFLRLSMVFSENRCPLFRTML
jgi:hypothetical protein